MRLLFAALLALMSLSLASPPAEACCVEATPVELFDRADVVFFGRVVRQTHPLDKGGTESEFEVERVLKGTPGARLALWEATGPAPLPGRLTGQWMSTSVDVGFQMGQRYIVFAARTEDGWASSICSGTRPLSSLTEETLAEAGLGDLAAYLPGVAPDVSGTEAATRSAGVWWAALLAGPALVAAGMAARRRRGQ